MARDIVVIVEVAVGRQLLLMERPILFQAEMVRAILREAGETPKTQTRRVIKPQPRHAQVHDWKGERLYDGEHRMYWWKEHCWDRLLDSRSERDELAALSPYGVPEDRLWVRESFYQGRDSVTMPSGESEAYWTYPIEYVDQRSEAGWHDEHQRIWVCKRPSIFMPRSASRITLEVTEVRAQRIQDITGEDARAEGVRYPVTPSDEPGKVTPAIDIMLLGRAKEWGILRTPATPDARAATHDDMSRLYFSQLWDSINAKPKPKYKRKVITHYESYPWDGESGTFEHRGLPHHVHANPWCFAVSFRRLEGL